MSEGGIVDGIRVDNAQATGPQVQAFGSSIISRINDIPPNSIESVEIIKGPAAATLYGTEASNGVIQITTKSGSQGDAPTINFSTKQGAGWFRNAVDRMPTNYWRNPETGEIETLNMLALARERGDNVFRTGHTQRYALSARGGGENIQYYVGGNFSEDEGIEVDNSSRKWAVKTKVSVTPTDNININTSLNYTSGQYNLSREAGSGGAMWALLYSSPQFLDTPTRGYRSATPEAYREPFDDFQEFNRTTVSAQADHEPTNWLTQQLTVGVDRVSENNQVVAEQMPEKFAPFYNPTTMAGFKNVDIREALNTTVDYSATLDIELTESLTSNTTGGVQYYRDHTEFISADGEQFPAPDLSAIDATARTFGGNSSVENITLGVFLQEQLALNDRLFVTGAVRADDNSAFGQDFGLILYPKASLSWVISDEPFWDDVPFVDQLKLRGAYGRTGSQPDAFASLRTYQPVTGTEDQPAVLTQFVGNSDLGPEVGEEFEAGFDLSAFEDRVGLEFTYYNQRTRDAILQRDVSPSRGFPETQFTNAGEIRNWGVEALLRGRPVSTENVEWGLNFNFAMNQNEVIDLIGDQEAIVLGSQQHRIGYPVSAFFRRKVVSAELNDQGRAVNSMCADGKGGTMPCADAPRVYMGRPNPKFTGGFSTTLTLFDRLRFYAKMDFKSGHTKLNNTARARCQVFQVCEANVRPETVDPAVLAQYQSGGPLRNVFYEDSDFAKLRAVSAQYTLPQKWVAPLGARRVTFGLAARNLLTWAPDWTGLDPETMFLEGLDLEQNSVPQLTSIQARLNISF